MKFKDFFVFKPNVASRPSPYADGNYCLQKIVENWDVLNTDRYSIFDTVLQEAQQYSTPLHFLACAYACHYNKSTYRKQAILYFEKYLINPVPSSMSNFPIYVIYGDLGKDYEAEYDFKKAEFCYKTGIKLSPPRYYNSILGQYDAYPLEVFLGRLYLKIDTKLAVDYWQSLKAYPEYITGDPHISGFRNRVDIEYNNACEKHARGYVYKPRKK